MIRGDLYKRTCVRQAVLVSDSVRQTVVVSCDERADSYSSALQCPHIYIRIYIRRFNVNINVNANVNPNVAASLVFRDFTKLVK